MDGGSATSPNGSAFAHVVREGALQWQRESCMPSPSLPEDASNAVIMSREINVLYTPRQRCADRRESLWTRSTRPVCRQRTHPDAGE